MPVTVNLIKTNLSDYTIEELAQAAEYLEALPESGPRFSNATVRHFEGLIGQTYDFGLYEGDSALRRAAENDNDKHLTAVLAGVYHDFAADGSKLALTFVTPRSLPKAYAMNEMGTRAAAGRHPTCALP